MNEVTHEVSLKHWQELYDDKDAWRHSPDGHQWVLNELAVSLHAEGKISEAELADLHEQADAGYQWGVEEQLDPS